MAKKILLICGNLNQTTMQYQISQHLGDYEYFYTPYYSDGFIKILTKAGLTDFSVLGGQPRMSTENFLREKGLSIDYEGTSHAYDLVVTCSDLIVPKNIRQTKIVLIQEGMTDPENYKYHIVKNLRLPRYLANTSMTGLSDAYQTFCVMSEGWKELFINKGVNPDKIAVTGIPNFDNVGRFAENDFPHKDYVLAATSHLRETLKFENRKKFINNVMAIADGRSVIFKLHPNENKERAVREIEKYASEATIFTQGNTNHMIANCDTLVTKYSSVVLIAAAMGKTIYSDLDPEFLQKLTPLQNGGQSAKNIADICKNHLNGHLQTHQNPKPD